MHKFFFSTMLMLSITVGLSKNQSPSDLQKHLFNEYNSKVFPAKYVGDKVLVTIDLNPIYLRKLDEKKGIMVMDTWIFLAWNDSALGWNEQSFGYITSLNVPSSDIWKPDISVYNTSPGEEIFPQVSTNAIIFSNGSILWVPPATIHSICKLDYEDYPFDEQTCVIRLGSWTYGSKSIDISAKNFKMNTTNFFNDNAEWSLEDSSISKEDGYYDCCPGEYYTTVDYSFVLKRKGSSAMKIVSAVSCIAVLLSLFMFCLPPDSNYKILLGVLSELLLCLTALQLGAMIDSSEAQLIAGQHVYPFMYFVAILVTIELLVLSLTRLTTPWKAPDTLVNVSNGICQPLKLLSSRLSGQKEEEVEDHPWKLLAIVIDRITLVSAIIVAIVLKVL